MDPEARYQYLLSLRSVRETAKYVYEAAKTDSLHAFDFHAAKLNEAAELVYSVITVSSSN